MKKSNVIYKTEDGYLTNGVKLLENISDKILSYLTDHKLNIDGSNGQDFFKKNETEIGNLFELFEEQLELGNYILVDEEHSTIDTGMKILIDLRVLLIESIVE